MEPVEPAEASDDWTTDDVMTFLQLGSRKSTRAQLAAWGIRPVARQPGRDGLNLYRQQDVRGHAAQRPGRGYRSDLPKPAGDQ